MNEEREAVLVINIGDRYARRFLAFSKVFYKAEFCSFVFFKRTMRFDMFRG
jgi:hypothetical protein